MKGRDENLKLKTYLFAWNPDIQFHVVTSYWVFNLSILFGVYKYFFQLVIAFNVQY